MEDVQIKIYRHLTTTELLAGMRDAGTIGFIFLKQGSAFKSVGSTTIRARDISNGGKRIPRRVQRDTERIPISR